MQQLYSYHLTVELDCLLSLAAKKDSCLHKISSDEVALERFICGRDCSEITCDDG